MISHPGRLSRKRNPPMPAQLASRIAWWWWLAEPTHCHLAQPPANSPCWCLIPGCYCSDDVIMSAIHDPPLECAWNIKHSHKAPEIASLHPRQDLHLEPRTSTRPWTNHPSTAIIIEQHSYACLFAPFRNAAMFVPNGTAAGQSLQFACPNASHMEPLITIMNMLRRGVPRWF